jgi:subfamily B ATP-binding cassette protein MsbA
MGYETKIGDKGVKLSGGQRQRIAIARELFREPEIMILDEATSSLDTESEQLIQQSINSLKGERTIVIIAHRLSTVRNCDYIYVLKDGRIVEEGSFDELYGDEKSRFYSMCLDQNL